MSLLGALFLLLLLNAEMCVQHLNVLVPMHISGNVFFPAYILIHMENQIIYVLK